LKSPYLILAWLPTERFASVAACQKIGELLNAYGETLRAFGLQLAYHNHAASTPCSKDARSLNGFSVPRSPAT